MHSFSMKVEEVEYVCHYNGDMSGDVIITSDEDNFQGEKRLPYALMEALVGEAYKSEETGKLDDMSGVDFLRCIFNYHVTPPE